MLTAPDIRITGHLTVDTILQFHMSEKLNCHTLMAYSGIVKEERFEEVMQDMSKKDTISLSLSDELVFSGIPLDVKLVCKNQLYIMTVSCVSFSYILDVESRSCSFQDTSLTHKDVLQKLYQENGIGHILFRKINDNSIKLPIIKYKETDWQFTLRMAARIDSIVYPHSPDNSPAVYLGIKNTNKQLDQFLDYSEGFETERYIKQIEQKTDRSLPDYFSIRFKAENEWKLGEQISVKGQSVVVCEKTTVLKDDVIEINYLLSGIYPYVPEEKTNQHLAGLTLSGRVIDTKGEQIKLHLDIDKAQDKEAAYWYDYKPVTGNVFYSMPQHGTTAMLKMNRCADGSGLVTHVIHKNADDVAEMADYNKRYFTTEFRKRLAMIPNLLDFKSNDNFMELADSEGITATTTAHCKMTAEENISIGSKKGVQIATPEKVYVTKVGAKGGIDMSGGDIHIKSDESKLISKKSKSKTTFRTKLPPIEISSDLALKAGATVPAVSRPEAM